MYEVDIRAKMPFRRQLRDGVFPKLPIFTPQLLRRNPYRTSAEFDNAFKRRPSCRSQASNTSVETLEI
ncbi:hypothetical protein AWB69_09230 [Caballeronia udeis]|uniref:Uncharacterized protein n=1 Tax=Caballeronia udeis TaxID=1232866 RepID=A0A158K1V7_9BURK|nr:hypothetical protein AWB69_09230 [Caballeronia udeis]